MKFNSSKAIQKALFLITSILTLNACGSGGAEESDTIAPVINVQVADTTVWAQSDVKFDISVTDNKDSTISYTLNCNAGETSGAILSTPNVNEITDISCQITARDSAGNSATKSQTITVNPVKLTVTQVPEEITQGKVISFEVIGPEVSVAEAFGMLGNTEVTLLTSEDPIFDGQLLLFIPFTEVGSVTLEVTIASYTFTSELEINEAITVDNPSEYLTSEIDTFFEDYGDELESVDLDEIKSSIDSLTESEKAIFAIIFKQNFGPILDYIAEEELNSNGGQVAINAIDFEKCSTLGLRYVRGVILLASGSGIVGVGVLSTTGVVTAPLGVAISGVGLAIALKGASIMEQKQTEILNTCLEPYDDLLGSSSTKRNTLKYLSDTKVFPQDTTSTHRFDEDVPEQMEFEIDLTIKDEETKGYFVEATSMIVSLLNMLNETEVGMGKFTSLIARIDIEPTRTESVEGSLLRVKSVSEPNVSFDIYSSSSAWISFVADFIDYEVVPEQGYSEFTVTLYYSKYDTDISFDVQLFVKDEPELISWDEEGEVFTPRTINFVVEEDELLVFTIQNIGYSSIDLNNIRWSNTNDFELKLVNSLEPSDLPENLVLGHNENVQFYFAPKEDRSVEDQTVIITLGEAGRSQFDYTVNVNVIVNNYELVFYNGPGNSSNELVDVYKVIKPNDSLTVYNDIYEHVGLRLNGETVQVWNNLVEGPRETTRIYFSGEFIAEDIEDTDYVIEVYDASNSRAVSVPVNLTISNAGYRAFIGKTLKVSGYNDTESSEITFNDDFTYQFRSNPSYGTFSLSETSHTPQKCPDDSVISKFKVGALRIHGGQAQLPSYIIAYEDGTYSANSTYACESYIYYWKIEPGG